MSENQPSVDNVLPTPTPRYTIEGGLDFYKLLQDESEVDYNDSGKCLITHEPLNDTAVTLECNHSFNYLPLYKYVLKSKSSKFNNMEKKCIKSTQLKCPFCRNIQNALLPTPPDGVNAPLVHGVNAIEYSPIKVGKCCYDRGEGKEPCQITLVYTAYRDNQSYCFNHRALMKKKWDKEDKFKHKCTYLFCRGIKKGTPCGQTIRENIKGGLCKKHAKNIDKQQTIKSNADSKVDVDNVVIPDDIQNEVIA
jgi:hypothetical protein